MDFELAQFCPNESHLCAEKKTRSGAASPPDYLRRKTSVSSKWAEFVLVVGRGYRCPIFVPRFGHVSK